jgi:FKBP-type peptidyl-prolyl cis-trans isomerase FklB
MKLEGFLSAFLLFFGSIGLAQTMTNNDEQVMYSLGVVLADDIKKAGLDKSDKTIILKAIDEYLAGTNTVDLNTARSIVNKKKADLAAKAGQDFLAANGKKPGVTTTASGLQYEVINAAPAGGAKPTLTDKVKTHYHGTLIDGKVFDSSVQRGEPISFPVNGVIRGWQEVLQLMSVGDKWRVFIPYNLAYGERGAGASIPPYSALIFEVELLGINE